MILPEHLRARRMPVRAAVLLAALLACSVSAHAASSRLLTQPHWSIEVKGGYFYPAIDDWKTYYGDDRTWHYAGSAAYKVRRQVEAGIEAGFIRDRGTAYAPLNGVFTGRVTYEAAPVNLFLLARGVFSEQQWIVPYVGGGYTRMFYREKIEGQGTVRGAVNGYHGRAGLQLLLDNLDLRAANNMYLDYGVDHTYLFLEVQRIKADADTSQGSTVDLGGTSYLIGFLFEF